MNSYCPYCQSGTPSANLVAETDEDNFWSITCPNCGVRTFLEGRKSEHEAINLWALRVRNRQRALQSAARLNRYLGYFCIALAAAIIGLGLYLLNANLWRLPEVLGFPLAVVVFVAGIGIPALIHWHIANALSDLEFIATQLGPAEFRTSMMARLSMHYLRKLSE